MQLDIDFPTAHLKVFMLIMPLPVLSGLNIG